MKDPCLFIQGQLSFQYLPCNFYFHFQVAWGYNTFKSKWLMLIKTFCESIITEPMTHVELVVTEPMIFNDPIVTELVTPIE